MSVTPLTPAPVAAAADDANDLERFTSLNRAMPTDVRNTLSWLAHLLDASLPLRASEDSDEFANRHLNRGGVGLVALCEHLGPLTGSVIAHAFGDDMRQHPPTEVAGLYSDESPAWDLLDLPGGDTQSMPSGLVAAFAAGTLADVALVVVVALNWKPSRIVVHARAEDSTAAQAYLDDLRRRGREAESYLRGRCLQVRGDHDDIAVTPIDVPAANRRDVIVSDAVWRELDLNVSALF